MSRLSRKQIKELHRQRGWGGKRPGAGRKPDYEVAKQKIVVYVHPSTAQIVKKIKSKGFSPARVFEDCVSDISKVLNL